MVLYSYQQNDVKYGARCCVTRSDGEGKHARRGTREVALTRTLGFTNQLDTVTVRLLSDAHCITLHWTLDGYGSFTYCIGMCDMSFKLGLPGIHSPTWHRRCQELAKEPSICDVRKMFMVFRPNTYSGIIIIGYAAAGRGEAEQRRRQLFT